MQEKMGACSGVDVQRLSGAKTPPYLSVSRRTAEGELVPGITNSAGKKYTQRPVSWPTTRELPTPLPTTSGDGRRQSEAIGSLLSHIRSCSAYTCDELPVRQLFLQL